MRNHPRPGSRPREAPARPIVHPPVVQAVAQPPAGLLPELPARGGEEARVRAARRLTSPRFEATFRQLPILALLVKHCAEHACARGCPAWPPENHTRPGHPGHCANTLPVRVPSCYAMRLAECFCGGCSQKDSHKVTLKTTQKDSQKDSGNDSQQQDNSGTTFGYLGTTRYPNGQTIRQSDSSKAVRRTDRHADGLCSHH